MNLYPVDFTILYPRYSFVRSVVPSSEQTPLETKLNVFLNVFIIIIFITSMFLCSIIDKLVFFCVHNYSYSGPLFFLRSL